MTLLRSQGLAASQPARSDSTLTESCPRDIDTSNPQAACAPPGGLGEVPEDKESRFLGGLGEEPAALLPTACPPSSLQRDKVLTGPSEYGRFQQEQTSSCLLTLVLTEVPGGFANPTRGLLMEGNKTPC